MDELDAQLERIGQHHFRAKFRLRGPDRAVVELRGLAIVRRHAEDLIERRLAPAEPRNDGRQTPYRGHPVFVAQHATATCCRTCLARWHNIRAGHALDDAERGYVVEAICRWIVGQYGTGPPAAVTSSSRHPPVNAHTGTMENAGHDPRIQIRAIRFDDAEDILALQRAAFLAEARAYEDPTLPALVQSAEELRYELQHWGGFVAIVQDELVGFVRTREHLNDLQINRLAVSPRFHGHGIGTCLLVAVENSCRVGQVSLFVRSRNEQIVEFYRRRGYVPEDDRHVPPKELVRMVKQVHG